MDTRQMIYFKAIADCGSISAAAKHLHLSQPPLSFQMKKLEEELGTELFIRGSRQIRLTEAGKIFYERASRILDMSDSMLEEIKGFAKRRTARIGITPTCVPVAIPLLKRLSDIYPDTRFEIYDADTFKLKDLLESGHLDSAFIRTPVNLSGLNSMKIMDDHMVALSPASKPSSPSGQISLKDLEGTPLILYRRYQSFIRNVIQKTGVEIDCICECDDARTAISLVENRLGTAIIPASATVSFRDLQVNRILSADLETSILFAWKNKNDITSRFIRILEHD